MSLLLRSRNSIKLTPRQSEVMDNLQCVTTDGARHEPQFRLGDKNVSIQVRSLGKHGLIELKDGRLIPVEQTSEPRRSVDTEATVAMMRGLLGDGA